MQVSDEYIIMASIVCPTATEAAARLNMSLATYRKQASRLGCYKTNRGSQKKREFTDEFDDTYFDVIDSDVKAYFLGYIAADGCVHNNRLSFCIQRKDEEVLIRLCNELHRDVDSIKPVDYEYVSSNGKLQQFRGCRLELNSWHLVNALKQYNIVERKSFMDIDLFQKIPMDWRAAWLAGFLDGDGNISLNPSGSNGCVVSFLGNHKTIESIQSFLRQVFNITGGSIYVRNNLSNLAYGAKVDVYILLGMYCFSTSVHLSRKLKLVEQALRSYVTFGNFRNHFSYIPVVYLNNDKKSKVNRVVNYCIDCGVPISPSSKRCNKCEQKVRRLSNSKCPKKQILISILKEVKNFKKIGEFYGVSDNAVRKWCKYYGLPFRTTDLRQMTDEDWSKYEVN